MPHSAEKSEGGGTAIAAEALFLVNLLLLPGIGFVLLLWLWWRHREDSAPLARAHLSQAVSGSIWAGSLLIVANALILLLGGYQGPQVWVVLIIYFTVCHSMLVLCGAFGLAKAMSGQCWRYPLVGTPLPAGCPEA